MMNVSKILDYVFIPNGRCPICSRVIFFSEDFICHECQTYLEKVSGKGCKKCGKEVREDVNYCSDCISFSYHFEQGYSLYKYEGNTKTIIQQIKFNNCPELGVYMGKQLGEGLLIKEWVADVDLIIPVPLHKNRMKQRGYNQSEKISWGIISVFVEHSKTEHILLDIHSLNRKKDTAHQLELSKEERFNNLQSAFEVTDGSSIKDKVILLIDDVYTTGATIESCSKELIGKGAKKVFFAVLASGRLM